MTGDHEGLFDADVYRTVEHKRRPRPKPVASVMTNDGSWWQLCRNGRGPVPAAHRLKSQGGAWALSTARCGLRGRAIVIPGPGEVYACPDCLAADLDAGSHEL